MTPSASLRIAVDADLSAPFTDLVTAASSPVTASTAALFHPPPRAALVAERRTNAVAQTVVLTLHPTETAEDTAAHHTPAASSPAVSQRTSAVYAVVVFDAQQVPMLLSTATATRCPVHESGAGPLGFYLDAVVEGVVTEQREEKPLADATVSSRIDGFDVHLSLIVVPNATVSLEGMNSTNVNITAKETATLFAAATAWAAARQHHQQQQQQDGEPAASVDESYSSRERVQPRVCASLDLCTTAAQPRQAVQMIAALGNKVLKNWVATTATTVSTTAVAEADASAAMTDLKDVRPDTQRKCVPTDFHALYTSMLTEVSSFSDRKTIAAVTAFPTMCHLLEYVDGVMRDMDSSGGGGESSNGNGSIAAGGVRMPNVYSTNFGEQRSWNVLNDAIVEALVTDYRPS